MAGIELDVIGETLGSAYQQAIVMGGAGVLVGADRGKVRIRTILEIKEPRMSGISGNDGKIGVPFTEQAESPLSDVLDFTHQGFGELMLDSNIDAAHFRIS